MKLFCQSLRYDPAPPKSTFEKTARDDKGSAGKAHDPNAALADGVHSSDPPKVESDGTPTPSDAPSTKGIPQNHNLSSLLSGPPESMPDGVIISNQKGEIIHINASAKRMLGASPPSDQSDKNGTHLDMPDHSTPTMRRKIRLTEVAPPRPVCRQHTDEENENLANVIQRAQKRLDAICEAQGPSSEMSQVKVEGERIIISISCPLKTDETKTSCTVTVLRDTDKALRLSRLKADAFLKISHDLRTPLTVIKGSIDNLLQGIGGKLTQKQRSYLNQTRESAEKLVEQIEKLLTVENIDFRIFGR